MNENQLCLGRKKHAIFTGNLIIHKIFLCSVVPDKACIEEGNRALLCAAVSSSSFRKIQRGYGKYITCMSKIKLPFWQGNLGAFLVLFPFFFYQECISKLFNHCSLTSQNAYTKHLPPIKNNQDEYALWLLNPV